MIRKLFAALVLCAVAATLTGCGDNGNTVNKTDPNANTNVGKPGAPPAPPAPPPLPPGQK